jgi:hypothetical protein
MLDWSKIIDAIKLLYSRRIVIAVFFTSIFLLLFRNDSSFLPEFIKTNIWAIWIIFIFNLSMIVRDIVVSIKNIIDKLPYSYRFKRFNLKRHIKSLNVNEKAILREFFVQRRDLIKLPINDPDVASLIRKRLIFSGGN